VHRASGSWRRKRLAVSFRRWCPSLPLLPVVLRIAHSCITAWVLRLSIVKSASLELKIALTRRCIDGDRQTGCARSDAGSREDLSRFVCWPLLQPISSPTEQAPLVIPHPPFSHILIGTLAGPLANLHASSFTTKTHVRQGQYRPAADASKFKASLQASLRSERLSTIRPPFPLLRSISTAASTPTNCQQRLCFSISTARTVLPKKAFALRALHQTRPQISGINFSTLLVDLGSIAHYI